jgi:hypothetical protein
MGRKNIMHGDSLLKDNEFFWISRCRPEPVNYTSRPTQSVAMASGACMTAGACLPVQGSCTSFRVVWQSYPSVTTRRPEMIAIDFYQAGGEEP